jgi:hypothetical protein
VIIVYKKWNQNGEQEDKTGPGGGGLLPVGSGEDIGKVNMVEMLCTHVCKCKNKTC